MKLTPTYRLAPQWRPLPGERTEGDGHTTAPFLERVTKRRDEILEADGPDRRPRRADGRFLPDPQPRMCFVLLVVAGMDPAAPRGTHDVRSTNRLHDNSRTKRTGVPGFLDPTWLGDRIMTLDAAAGIRRDGMSVGVGGY